MATELLIIFFLLILNGLLSMAEIALVSARKTRLDLDARNGDRSAQMALDNANSPSRILSTIQIGITLIGILTGVYSGAALGQGLAGMLAGAGMSTTLANTLAIALLPIPAPGSPGWASPRAGARSPCPGSFPAPLQP